MKTDGKILGAILALGFCLLAADAAVAKDEVMLRDGTTALVEVLETTPDTVKVKFKSRSGAEGEAVLRAANMDVVNFYTIRRKYMETTVENHVKLAVFCFRSGDFNRAKRQWDLAVNLDPELVAKLEERPDIVEKIAAAIFEGVLDFERKGDIESAHRVASRLVARIPEAPSSDKAREWLKNHEAEHEANRVKQEEAKAEEAAKEEQEELAANEKILKPVREFIDKGHKYNAAGLQEKSSSRSRSAYDAAASQFLKAIERTRKEKGEKDVNPALADALGKLEAQAVSECVDSFLNAGNVSLGSGNSSGAKKYAEKALEVDPGNKRAQDLKTKAEMAATDKFYLDDIRDRRPRRGARPGRGGGRR
ncbi:MAG: hypothetical protein ABFS86_03565 [Planctomycetota bacterium]